MKVYYDSNIIHTGNLVASCRLKRLNSENGKSTEVLKF